MLLAVDTSAVASAAVLDGERVLASATSGDPRRHAEVLQPLVEQVLAEAGVERRGLSGVVTGVGPGPYTGLRVGMAAALVTGLALDLPVHGVCSLDGLALAAWRGGVVPGTGERLGVATDARRREVYWASYAGADGGPRRVAGPGVGAAADIADEAAAWVGPGVDLYADHLPAAPQPAHRRRRAADAPSTSARRRRSAGDGGSGAADSRRSAGSGALAAWVGLVAAEALAGRGALPLVPVEPLYLRRPDAVALADRTPPPLPTAAVPS
ncbi:tRNA (adenosine(37)-N6)-threonylcarbamoyltransferase complex dimerization subunit type 1 TsaB [Pseudokineococcus sp. 1T1Z-3]|uniref:tRNA (adenosine(37)-N6)-threonylcarbamoyltransferase complex dimerization subunit type 1 TsaB n=1 Tax=Pseudokineococcus sp. 1T1Z-3 TaxID=3132745 RepID=UPI0030951E58